MVAVVLESRVLLKRAASVVALSAMMSPVPMVAAGLQRHWAVVLAALVAAVALVPQADLVAALAGGKLIRLLVVAPLIKAAQLMAVPFLAMVGV